MIDRQHPDPADPAAAQAGDPVAPAAPEHSADARVAELEAELAAMKDRYVRAAAETENVRRRGEEAVAKANKFGIESFAEALLPVKDSLELALKADNQTLETLREGVQTTLKLLAGTLERNGVREVDPAGERFDPNVHQAISMVPVGSGGAPVPANHVASVLQKGYLINDRVLRPALVTVAQG